MSGEFGAVVGRRGRAEIERLASLYGTSGMGRSEFCRSHGMALSTLNRHLKKQQNRQNQAGSDGVEQRRLVAVELASAVTTVPAGEYPGGSTVLLSNRRVVEQSLGEKPRLASVCLTTCNWMPCLLVASAVDLAPVDRKRRYAIGASTRRRDVYGVGSANAPANVSELPKVAGQSVFGAGDVGGEPSPSTYSTNADRKASTAGQSAALRTSFQAAMPAARVATA